MMLSIKKRHILSCSFGLSHNEVFIVLWHPHSFRVLWHPHSFSMHYWICSCHVPLSLWVSTCNSITTFTSAIIIPVHNKTRKTQQNTVGPSSSYFPSNSSPTLVPLWLGGKRCAVVHSRNLVQFCLTILQKWAIWGRMWGRIPCLKTDYFIQRMK